MRQLWNHEDTIGQVPGKDYRQDHTPSSFEILKPLNKINIQHLSDALAKDLEELAIKYAEKDYILTLREIIDGHLREIKGKRNHPGAIAQTKRNLQMLTREFFHFQEVLDHPQLLQKQS